MRIDLCPDRATNVALLVEGDKLFKEMGVVDVRLPVYILDGLRVRKRELVWPDAHNIPVLLV